MHVEFNALPQDAKVAQSRLDSSLLLRRDSGLRKEVIRTLLRFADVISIGGYGKTNLISHASTVDPGTTQIQMKQRPLNPVMEESLRRQVDQWFEQRVVEEVYSPWSFPLAPVSKKNSQEVRLAIDYRRLKVITKKVAFPLPHIADNLSGLAGSRVFSALDGAGAFHAVPVQYADREKTLEVLCYPDDTAVHSEDAWGHLRIVREILVASCALGLSNSSKKAQLLRDRIKYPGHEVSAPGTSIPRDTPPSSRTGRSRTHGRCCEPSRANANTTSDSSQIVPPFPRPRTHKREFHASGRTRLLTRPSGLWNSNWCPLPSWPIHGFMGSHSSLTRTSASTQEPSVVFSPWSQMDKNGRLPTAPDTSCCGNGTTPLPKESSEQPSKAPPADFLRVFPNRSRYQRIWRAKHHCRSCRCYQMSSQITSLALRETKLRNCNFDFPIGRPPSPSRSLASFVMIITVILVTRSLSGKQSWGIVPLIS